MAMIIINFKNYKKGKETVKLAKLVKKHLPGAVVCVPVADLHDVSKTGIKTFAQHVDAAEPGRGTGFITAESVRSEGASGTLLNHSEHPLPFDVLKKSIERCKKNKIY